MKPLTSTTKNIVSPEYGCAFTIYIGQILSDYGPRCVCVCVCVASVRQARYKEMVLTRLIFENNSKIGHRMLRHVSTAFGRGQGGCENSFGNVNYPNKCMSFDNSNGLQKIPILLSIISHRLGKKISCIIVE